MQVFEYALPLARPLALAGREALTERCGILLHDPETGGWGEAAPLPGFSRESLQSVREAVRGEEWEHPDCPSLRFALQCVRSDWSPPREEVRCNGLWIPAAEPVSEVVRRLRDWREPVLKVKPGARPDLEALRQLTALRPDVRFRIDGNRQWTVPQSLEVAEALPQETLEYMEEPLQDPGDYGALWSRSPVPVALDESLLKSGGEELATRPEVVALVLKPTLLGGKNDWRPWMNAAESGGKTLVWSSCFESGVGLWHLARLAAGGAAAGLDTGAWFREDVVTPLARVRNGRIPIARSLQVERSFLRPRT
jgi:O-succinylbenzoate synthase